MSALWDYFKNSLRFPLILKPGPLAQMAKGGAEDLDGSREDELWLRDQFLANVCDDDFIGDFAESRGIKRWPHESDMFWKDRVVKAYVFYFLGGKKAGVEEIFTLAGIDAEIIEPRELRDAWVASGGVRLDGSWQVDGSEKLIAPFSESGTFQLAWAEFMVRASLDDAVDPVWQSLARHIIAEFKPARSIPGWMYVAETDLDQDHTLESEGYLKGASVLSGFDCPLKLDGSWGLGRVIRVDGTWAVRSTPGDCYPVKLGMIHQDKIVNLLNGSWDLDGSKQLSCTPIPHIKISPCKVETGADITVSDEIEAARPVGDYFVVSSSSPVSLDGSKQVGIEHEGTWPYVGGDVVVLPYPVAFYDEIFGGTAAALPGDILDGGDSTVLPDDPAVFGGTA